MFRFDNRYAECFFKLGVTDAIVLVQGRVDKNSEGDIQFLASRIDQFAAKGNGNANEAYTPVIRNGSLQPAASTALDDPGEHADDEQPGEIVLDISAVDVDDIWLARLDGIVDAHPGSVPLQFRVGSQMLKLDRSVSAEAEPLLRQL